ncbi:MAG: hypothetical protein ACPGYP_02800 [Solirubrobacterales bacterium]
MPDPEIDTQPAVGRQMTDEELVIENSRGRVVGVISVVTVAAMSAYFFCLWLVQKDRAAKPDQATDLVLISDNSGFFILAFFFLAVGSLLLAPVLLHLALAIRSRVPKAPRLIPILAVVGPVAVAIALPAFTFVQVSVANDFADGTIKTVAEATRLAQSDALDFTRYIYLVAQLVLAVAWAMVGVFSVRVGLLTKVVGYVAVAIGLASVIAAPLAAILSVFWIGAVSIMLLGRGSQRPPAWAFGRAVSWREIAEKGEEIRQEADREE